MAEAVVVYPGALGHGESSEFGRVLVFNGGVGVDVAADGVVSAVPVPVYRLRCVVAGTIILYDNASAASGRVLVASTAMTANQVIEIHELVANGVYADWTSGSFVVTIAPVQ